jgi:hypothetical protein
MFVLLDVHVNSFSINRVRYALNPYVAILYSGLIKKYTCLFYDIHFCLLILGVKVIAMKYYTTNDTN